MGKREAGLERQIAVGAIVSTSYLALIVDAFDKKYIASDHLRHIMVWCVNYYKKYQKAPVKGIQAIFEREKRTLPDEDLADNIESVLDSLSKDWEGAADEFDPKYMADKALEYFKVRSHAILAEQLSASVENYDAKMGEEALEKFQKVSASLSHRVRILEDAGIMKLALEKAKEPLFKLPGDLGKMMNAHLVPGGFLSFLGPEKRGKSWWLMELAVRACRAHVPTVVFQAGDMDDADLAMRLYIRLCKKSDREKYCGRMLVPVLDCALNQDDTCSRRERASLYGVQWPNGPSTGRKRKKQKDEEAQKQKMLNPEELLEANPDYAPCSFCRRERNFKGAAWWKVREEVEPLTEREIKETVAKYVKTWKTSPFVLSYPTNTLTVPMMSAELDRLEREENFKARAVFVDYADILACHQSRLDFRHQQAAIWAALRGLALERNMLVVTATQADAASYDQDTLELHNFSEDKRKYGYVTGMFGLNQTSEERALGLMRINTLIARNESYSFADTVTVMQCLQIGQPLLGSFFKK